MSPNEQLVYEAYRILLNRGPDPIGAEYWKKSLDEGLSRDQLLSAIIASDEFNAHRPAWYDTGKWGKLNKLNADITISLPFGGRFVGPVKDTSVFSTILEEEGHYEPHVTKFLTDNLHEGDTFVDGGANLGYFTILGSRLVGPEGRVIAFEPMPINHEYCEKNIALNKLNNVRLYNNGLWDKPEKKEIMIPSAFYAGAHFGKSNAIERKALIECIPLDQMNLDPDVIKMDIEGAEPMALRGMLRTLKKSKPLIVLELNRSCLRTFYGLDTQDIWNPLKAAGYEISVLSNDIKRVDSIEQLNAICSPETLVDLIAFA